jgi:hypothetical protein
MAKTTESKMGPMSSQKGEGDMQVSDPNREYKMTFLNGYKKEVSNLK